MSFLLVRESLSQAIGSQHAPAGAVMLTGSAVDAMLKDKGYKDGTLNAQIDATAKDHLITAEMAAWAHEIRLNANDQRHADESTPLPSAAAQPRLSSSQTPLRSSCMCCQPVWSEGVNRD